MSFAQRLKEVMDERRPRLTYQSIATLAGVTPPAVGGWLRQGAVPHHRTMARLAAGLGVRLEWLCYGTGKKKASELVEVPSADEENERADLVRRIMRKLHLLEPVLDSTEMRVFDDFVDSLCERHGIGGEPGTTRVAEQPDDDQPPDGPTGPSRIGFHSKRQRNKGGAHAQRSFRAVGVGDGDGKTMR